MFRRVFFVALAVASLRSWAPPRAHANGAFPTASEVLVPIDAPAVTILGTNFGIIVSDDGGQSWRWACEHDKSVGAYFYQLAAPPSRRLLALAGAQLAFSDDLGCTWGALPAASGTVVYDYFPVTGDANRVLLLTENAATRVETISVADVRPGAAAAQVLFTTKPLERITTVEMARSDAHVIYATLMPSDFSEQTGVLRSGDAGQSWVVAGPTEWPALDLRIVAVDPTDPERLYFRGSTMLGEDFVVSADGGKTVRSVISIAGTLTAFVRVSEQVLLVAAQDGLRGVMFRSSDGGATFAEIPTTIHARSLAVRDGKVYAAANSDMDGFAIAVSDDMGTTWSRAMGYPDVGAIARCGAQPGACLDTCRQLVIRTTIPAAICALPDGGSGMPVNGDDGGSATGPDGGAGSGEGSGCACVMQGPWPSRGATGLAGAAIVGLLAMAIRRRAR